MTETADPVPRPKRSRGGRRRRSMKRLVALLAVALVVEYLVLPQLAGAREALDLVGGVDVLLLVLAVALEVAALLAYAQLLHSLLPKDERPRRRMLLRIQLSTKALSNVVPAGAAAGTGLGYDLLRREGVGGVSAGFALGTQAVGSAVVLNALLWVALLVSIPRQGFDPLYGTAAVVGAVLLSVLAGVVVMLTRGEERAGRIARHLGRSLPFTDSDATETALRNVSTRLREVATDRRTLAAALGWAAANWLLDAGALWVFLYAFGQEIPSESLVVAFGIANVVGALPITPGGLGIIEGVLTPLLVGFGATSGGALLGVIAWRLVNFWVPIPVGAASYLSLRLGRQRRGRRVEELRRIVEGGPIDLEAMPDRNWRSP